LGQQLVPLINNIKDSQFEYQIDGYTTYARYRLDKNILYIDYVFAPPELRGTGAAGKLMELLVQYAKEKHLDIIPICGYAAAWLSRHKK